MAEFRLKTERLILRDWRDSDLDDFHRLGSDPEVMKTLGPLMSREQTADFIQELQRRASRYGHTVWAVERKEDQRVLGFTGLIRGQNAPIVGELEIGWRLASDCWGQGYATEAARASVEWARAHCPDRVLVAITSVGNRASRAVMERLGMTYNPTRDFDHPKVPEGDPLRPHVLYEMELAA